MSYSTLSFQAVLMLAPMLIASACSTKGIVLDDGNNLLVNKFGVLCNPSIAIDYDRRKVVCTSENDKAYVADGDLQELVRTDLQAAKQLAVEKQSDKTRLLIYIHGGLNKVEKSIEENKALTKQIVDDPVDWSYPRFLVWPSDGTSNYSEHALNVSGGRYSENPIRGLFGGVATLVADFLGSVVDVPRSWYIQGVNLKDTFWGLNEDRYEEANNAGEAAFQVSYAWVQARDNFCSVGGHDSNDCSGFIQDARVSTNGLENATPLKGANLYWSSYERDSKNPFENPRWILERVAGLSRISVGALAHGEIGTASWRNMKRRATNISSPTVLFDSRIRHRHSCSRNGKSCVSGSDYFSEVLRQINQDSDPLQFEVTLIGHSMGAFVLNDLVNAHVDSLAKHGVLKNVVYMAAAMSIKQAADTMYNLYNTYHRNGVNEQEWPSVYNLMLNRISEINEMMFYALVPSGSLLTWIDDVYEKPTHPTERTFGSEVNVYAALPSIRQTLGPFYTEKITFKSFDRISGSKPDKHGDFNDGQFWKPDFWRIGEKSDPSWVRYEKM